MQVASPCPPDTPTRSHFPKMQVVSPRPPDTPTRSHFLAVPHLMEVLPSRAIVPQDQRPTAQDKLSKLRESVTSPLANVFNLIPLDAANS